MTTANSQVGRTFGKYTLSRLLGKGGMGDVYEAYDTDKGRTVALKILAEQYSHDEQFRTRCQRESHAAAILREPHVIPIHDLIAAGDPVTVTTDDDGVVVALKDDVLSLERWNHRLGLMRAALRRSDAPGRWMARRHHGRT